MTWDLWESERLRHAPPMHSMVKAEADHARIVHDHLDRVNRNVIADFPQDIAKSILIELSPCRWNDAVNGYQYSLRIDAQITCSGRRTRPESIFG